MVTDSPQHIQVTEEDTKSPSTESSLLRSWVHEGALILQDWSLQDSTIKDKVARVDMAALDNDRPGNAGNNKKLSYCWETVQRESMPRIAEMDVEMTT